MEVHQNGIKRQTNLSTINHLILPVQFKNGKFTSNLH